MRLILTAIALLNVGVAQAQTIHQFTGNPSLDAAMIACDANQLPPTMASPGPAWAAGYAACATTLTQWTAARAATAAMPPARPFVPVPRPQPSLLQSR